MSYEGTIVVEGVEYGSRLPRGRHGIPQALVTENQRDRLLDAATEIFSDQGYAALAVANVIQQAGVSRGTFYEIFDNKFDCLLAAVGQGRVRAGRARQLCRASRLPGIGCRRQALPNAKGSCIASTSARPE